MTTSHYAPRPLKLYGLYGARPEAYPLGDYYTMKIIAHHEFNSEQTRNNIFMVHAHSNGAICDLPSP